MKIIVLDFASGIPYVFDFPKECSDAEDFFDTEIAKEYNLREGNCDYMVTNEEIQKQIKMEKETLEEAAEKRIPTSTKVWDLTETRRSDFKAGAKWQVERMYSEEDLEYAFEQGKLNSNICYRRTFKNVLEILQFKKK